MPFPRACNTSRRTSLVATMREIDDGARAVGIWCAHAGGGFSFGLLTKCHRDRLSQGSGVAATFCNLDNAMPTKRIGDRV